MAKISLEERPVLNSVEQYRMLLESMDQGFCIIEVIFNKQNKPVDYRFLETNPSFIKQTGLSNAIGKTMKELVPDMEGHWFETYGRVVLSGKSIRFEDGSAAMGRWFEVHAVRLGDIHQKQVAVFFTDVTKRKEAEQKQEEATQQVVEVLDSMGDGFFSIDKNWNLARANRVYEEITQVTKKQSVGRNFWETFPGTADPDSKYWIEYNNVMTTREPAHFIEYYPPLDLWTEVDAFPTNDGGISVFFRDVSERKRTESTLKHQLRLTETITNNATVCLFLINTDGLITYMNPAATKVTGHKLEDVIGTSMHKLLHHSHPDGTPYPENKCGLVQTYKYGKQNPLHEDIFFRKNGKSFPALITGRPITGSDGVEGTVLEFRDITEEKRSIQSLADSEARLRFLAESMPQKVFSAAADGNVDYFNPQWMEFTGLTLEQIKNWGWTQFIHPEDLDENVTRWQHSLDTGKPFLLEHRFKRYDGVYRWHLSRAKPMRDEHGKIVRWFGSNTDIEDIKSTIKRKDELESMTVLLREQREELVALNQSKDEFISLASHQLRTPATGVKQYVGMMLEGYAGDLTEIQQHFLSNANKSNDRQLRIIDDLLKVATADSGNMSLVKEKVDLVELIQSVIEEQTSRFVASKQKVSFIHQTDEVYVRVDRNSFRMVLENLIDNAHKYTYRGKKIEIKVKKLKDKVTIAVKDQGTGIAADDFDKLFQKFSRLDNPLSVSSGGTGLGLYWAKQIIKLHHGTISVDSEPEKGTTFTISLKLDK